MEKEEVTVARVEVVHGKLRWYWHLVAANGEVLAHSQGYFSKSNAMRAAEKLATGMEFAIKEVTEPYRHGTPGSS